MSAESARTVSFEVTTVSPLPTGEQVFIAGAPPELGSWNPAGFPLAREDECLWVGRVVLPGSDKVEFKVTRGAWENEQVHANGSLLPNHEVPAGDDRRARIQVLNWADRPDEPLPEITGDYRIHDAVTSRYLRHSRRVIVWLPPSYPHAPERRYPVVYLHDGQQVFDPHTSTWGQDWQVDECCTRLIGEGRLREIIAVGIYCTEDRDQEYDPGRAGEAYTRFVVEELKPLIDAEYRTAPGRDSTAVAGASRGGCISFYMAWTRPETFMGAACLSPAFRYQADESMLALVRASATVPDIKCFLYCGKADELEEELMPGMLEMETLLLGKGFKPGRNLRVSEDPYAAHNEAAWAAHTEAWLLFLFAAP
jgi:predicted alpha/beta superfamily hydrolase